MSAAQSSLTVGTLIRDFVLLCEALFVTKDDRDVIISVTGPAHLHELFQEIQERASEQLFSQQGTRRPLREAMMANKYGYPIVAIESCGEEWLHLGIQTPLGIIPYDL